MGCWGSAKPKAPQPSAKKEEPKPPVKKEEPKPTKVEEAKPQKVTTKKDVAKGNLNRFLFNIYKNTLESDKKKGAAGDGKQTMEEEDDSSALQKLLKDNKIDDSAKIDNKYTMHLDPKSNNKGVSDFLKAAKGKKIGKLKKFSLFYTQNMKEDGLTNMASFINSAQITDLQILYLHGGDKAKFASFDKTAVKNLWKAVTNQVYIDTFTLEEADIKNILENWVKAKEIWLINCKVANLSSKFEINLKDKPTVQTLDLYYSLLKDNKEYIDETKFKQLISAISKSSFKLSLKKIHYHEFDYPKQELEDIVKESDLKALKIVGDENEPEVLE